MAVKWTKQTRSKNRVQEQFRKKISDAFRDRKVIHHIDPKRIIIAKTRRMK